MTSESLAARDAALARLADETWDVLIIGGGIVGSGASVAPRVAEIMG